ncbi:YebC/PmpR family DNA-binding transcriptional regulator [Legionella shakespearei]|uniref:Probable transcriptional regulatory protein Lsha_1952 n=1 Tax=Legionella shakespearei DSM 23087 TaxID=1122169 RepID=A0A0W0YQT2_9GAMM|nr:YebC/PmpR family DNA-binding transcriptional regulator [Legionella shakespearei]KTD59256.1 YebC [Legionella shakespearei DSM 23087]
MAGHSKWANIKFRKGVQDAKRGKIFTKLIREITVAARMGGGDESTNPRLRDAVKKALSNNMKRDTIDNAVKRGVGGLDGDAMVAMRYEGYGPGGIAVLVDCLSDNKNRTVSDVRHAFTKNGGNLGTDGSVSYLFSNQGEILMTAGQSEDQVMEVAIDAGASDVSVDEDQIEIITPVESYHAVLNALQDAGLAVEQSHLTMRAQTLIAVDDETADSLIKLIDMLEDLDDVQEVYYNAEFSESLLESMN